MKRILTFKSFVKSKIELKKEYIFKSERLGFCNWNENDLTEYFESGQLKEKGIPSIEQIADSMSISKRYLSDTLKKETGKTTTEHLHLHLIDQAKNILLQPNKSVSEVAYELGFEYPPYFSRLFKKKEGISPTEYREKYKPN